MLIRWKIKQLPTILEVRRCGGDGRTSLPAVHGQAHQGAEVGQDRRFKPTCGFRVVTTGDFGHGVLSILGG